MTYCFSDDCSPISLQEKKRASAAANPQAIIDELKNTDLPAEVILDRQRKIKIEAELAEKEEALRKKRESTSSRWQIFLTYFRIF